MSDSEPALTHLLRRKHVRPSVSMHRACNRLRVREAHQAFLLDLNRRLRSLSDPEQIQYVAACALGTYFQADRVGYAEDQGDGTRVAVTRNYTNGVPGIEGQYHYMDYGPGLVQALRAGQTVVRPDIANDPLLTEEEKAAHAVLQLGATVNVPLLKDDQLVAILFMHTRAAHFWSAAEVTLIEEVAVRIQDAVERERTEAALRASELRYRSLFEIMGVAFMVCELIRDAQGQTIDYRFLEMNQAFQTLTGVAPEAAIGQTARTTFPGMEESWIATYERVVDSGEIVRFEYYSALLGRWYQVVAFPYGPERFAAIFDDITPWKTAETLLQEHARHQAFLLRLNDQLRLINDPAGIQATACSMLGEHLQVNRVTCAEIEADTFLLRQSYVHAVAPFPSRGPVALFGAALCSAMQSDEAAAVNDVAHDARLTSDERASLLQHEIGAFMGMLLIKAGQPVAVWGLHSASARSWTDAERSLLREVAERNWASVERAQAAATLQASERRLQTITDGIPQLIWTNDQHGNVSYFNQRWCDYTGLSAQASMGSGWEQVVHPDNIPHAVVRWQHAMLMGESFEIEYQLRRADGIYRWHIGRNMPLHDTDGTVIGWFGSATDIEDLKQAEAARRESDERFRLLVEGAREYAMFLMDPTGRITFWSSGAERVLGWTEAELLGQSAAIIFTPEDQLSGILQDELHTAYTSGRAEDRRWHRRKDGMRIFIDGIMIRLDDAHGALRGFVKIGRDATQLRQAEEALQRSRDELEQRVAERTTELMHMSVMRQDLLQRLITVQEDERRRISRDLHDGLGQILSALSIDIATVQTLQHIPHKMQTKLDQLLGMLAQIDSKLDQLINELHPIALDDLGLEEALQSYVKEWEHHTTIQVDILTSGFSHVRMPLPIETAAYRIVQEALTNIRKHAQASHVSVIAEQWETSIRIIVEDNGIGFDPERARQNAAHARHFGLGAMQDRAHLVGGHLIIESEQGCGTTLYLQIPRPRDT